MYRRMREETMAVGSNRESENRPQWVEIDAGRSVEDVGKEIWIHVEPFVQPSGISKPISRLWMDRLPRRVLRCENITSETVVALSSIVEICSVQVM